jgi:hypothetical protein
MQYPMIAQPQYGFAPTMPMMANGGSVADAQSVQSKGRGRDTMLVHMTPKEVGGLQALAMQHGGSLTINPQTGLPEAGFLEAILPTLAGAALTIGSGGVINPYMSAAIVGGVQTARTGDLGQGLLAGLGAYGGAGLGAGLTSAGASAAPTAGLEFATNPTDLAAATGGEAAAAAGTAGTAGVPSSLGTTVNPVTLGDTGAAIYGGAPSPTMEAANLAVDEMAAQGAGAGSSTSILAPPSATPPPATFGSNFTQAGQGVKSIFEPGGFDKFIGDAAVKADPSKGIQAAPATGLGGGFGAAKTAAFAAAPALLAPPEYDAPASKKEEASNYEGPYTPSTRRVSYPGDDERRRTSEFTYFTPSNPVPFDEGGKVEEDRSIKMPDANYVGGVDPEFDHNFKAVEVQGMPVASAAPAPIGGKGAMGQALSTMLGKKNEEEKSKQIRDMSGYEYDPRSQRLVKGSSTGGLPALARGGSVPTLENGGFVLTKKAVDGLGRGNNEKGQANAQRGLGAIPIRGAGAKRGPKAGVDDKIKTTIDGKRPALVSNGEAYVPKKQVAKKGGAKAFYALMKQAEKAADKRRRA